MSYAQQSDIEAVFGVTNVARWSNLENDNNQPNTVQIQLSLDYANAWIDAFMANSQYQVPLVSRNGPMTIVTNLAARVAGVWLYENRGMADDQGDDGAIDGGRNKIAAHQKYVERYLNRVKSGRQWLPCQYIRLYTTQPQIFN